VFSELKERKAAMIASKEQVRNPSTIHEALSRSDSDEWSTAMKNEIDSLLVDDEDFTLQ
jgi:hypothetical protein